MTHPTPTTATSASPPPRGEGLGVGGFPLATLVARIMLATFLSLTLLTAAPWFFTRGPDVALHVLLSAMPNLLVLTAFAFLLPRGNPILAAVFALWCAWGLIDSLSGAPDATVALFGYAYGVLNFVGIVGVVKGFKSKANT